MRYRSSLYVRLTLALLGPLLLAMAVAWAIGLNIVTRSLEQRVEGQLRNSARVMARWELPYTPELLRRLASLQRSEYLLLDHRGEVAFSTASVSDTVVAQVAEFREHPASRVVVLKHGGTVPSLAVYEPVSSARDPRYSALVAVAPLDDVDAAARRAALWLGLAMLAAGALLGLVLLALTRNITRPLADLAALADRIAAGERERPLDLPREDEIGALAEALNTMMRRLASYETRLSARSRMSALGEMAARLAHEIRNPLTGLKLHLQLLAERVEAAESDRVARLLAEVQRLELLVSSTLMLGGDQPLDLAPTRVGSLVAEVLDLMGPMLIHRGVQTENRAADDLLARVDRARLRQALLNLIMNAADAMPHGGRLLVGAERDLDGSRLRVFVEDSGPGVSDEAFARLAEAPASSKPFGLGLGLAVCREIAAAHCGELLIGRGTELGGARFTVALPLDAASPAAVKSS